MNMLLDLSAFSTTLEQVASDIQGIVSPIAVVAMVICGIGWIISGQKGADNMKEMFKRILIGCVIALGASAIVTWITTLANTVG
ncbi:MAG TPA: hypothetical protein DEP00_04610 [Lachnospiraceae bacterium]|nr:hypothetical protein [Lachnospiraceae bacterium]